MTLDKAMHYAARTVTIPCAAALLYAASACTRCSDGRGDSVTPMSQADSAEVILQQRPEADDAAIAGLARDVAAGRQLSPVELSEALVNCCVAADKILQELEFLQSNDDVADTYHTLAEMEQSPDVTDIRALYDYLSRSTTTLTPAQEERRVALTKTLARINQTAEILHRDQLKGQGKAFKI